MGQRDDISNSNTSELGMVHIGEEIRKVFKQSKIKREELAKAVGISYRTLYNAFQQKSMHTDMLTRFCNALNYDFFSIYSSTVVKKALKGNRLSFDIDLQEDEYLLIDKELHDQIRELIDSKKMTKKRPN